MQRSVGADQCLAISPRQTSIAPNFPRCGPPLCAAFPPPDRQLGDTTSPNATPTSSTPSLSMSPSPTPQVRSRPEVGNPVPRSSRHALPPLPKYGNTPYTPPISLR